MGTHNGLVRFNASRYVYQTFHPKSGDKESLGSDLINDLYLDQSGQLWIALDDAVLIYWSKMTLPN